MCSCAGNSDNNNSSDPGGSENDGVAPVISMVLIVTLATLTLSAVVVVSRVSVAL